jgi:hypothetical protein
VSVCTAALSHYCSKLCDTLCTDACSFVSVLFARVVGGAVVTVLFQTFVMYAASFYGGENWVSVINKEYHNRDTACYGNALLNGVPTYATIAIGWILS